MLANMTLQIYNDKPTEYLTKSWFFQSPLRRLINLSLKLTKGFLTSDGAGIFLEEYNSIHISAPVL